MSSGDNIASSNSPDVDSFFGLTDSSGENLNGSSSEKRPNGLFRVVSVVRSSVERAQQRRAELKRQAELETLRQSATGRTPQIGDQHNELEANSVRLTVDADVTAEFIRAEQQDTLFEAYEKSRRVTMAVAKIGMLLSALTMVLLGAFTGPQYLSTLFSTPVAVPEILTNVSALPSTVAQGIVFVSGMVAPVVVLMLLGSGSSALVRGVVYRQMEEISSGSVALIGAVAVIAALSGQAYLTGLAIGIAATLIARIVWRVVSKVSGV